MIDCHTHLSDPCFDSDREVVVKKAMQAGVKRLAVVGQDSAENERVLALTADEPMYLTFLGLHPDRFADDRPWPKPEAVDDVIQQLETHRERLTGIGEIGLDYRVCADGARREAQRDALQKFAKVGIVLDLALNVHSRSAGHYTIDLLLEAGASRVLMHAFDGRASHALRAAEAGFLFSIPPSILRSEQKQKLVKRLPLKSLVLETDSPVLGPEKGVRNEPANVAISAQAMAEIKQIPLEEVIRTTTENAIRLFGLSEISA